MQKNVNIQNKRAKFEFEFIEKYTAGIVLRGTEIKSIRLGKASLADRFCEFHNGELFMINSHIQEYPFGLHYNHKAKRERKLLMNIRELISLTKNVHNKGLTIVPLRLFTNEKGLAKVDMALARGKKIYDKRETIKERENKINLDRLKKAY